jgi:hypothetical protein
MTGGRKKMAKMAKAPTGGGQKTARYVARGAASIIAISPRYRLYRAAAKRAAESLRNDSAKLGGDLERTLQRFEKATSSEAG